MWRMSTQRFGLRLSLAITAPMHIRQPSYGYVCVLGFVNMFLKIKIARSLRSLYVCGIFALFAADVIKVDVPVDEHRLWSATREKRFGPLAIRICSSHFDMHYADTIKAAENILAVIKAPALTFLFTGRDAAIIINSVKIDITQ